MQRVFLGEGLMGGKEQCANDTFLATFLLGLFRRIVASATNLHPWDNLALAD